MSILDWFRNRNNKMTNYKLEQTPENIYLELKALYDNAIDRYSWKEARPIRTVVNRSVEFYASKILSSYEIVSDNPTVKDSIDQILNWTNFDSNKQVYIRQLALYGDLFIRVVGDLDKVYFETIYPGYVTTFKTDTRGFLTEIRLDFPVVDENGNKKNHTEYWTKEYYSIWETIRDANTPLSELGTPIDTNFLSIFGIDFIPIVHIKFKDTGELRGNACVIHALGKIEEANKEATRLHDILFKKKIWALEQNAVGKDGAVQPSLEFEEKRRVYSDRVRDSKKSEASILDDTIITVPENSKVSLLIPEINYGGALEILNAMMEELEQDLPELRYYSIKDSNISGKAIKLLLDAAIDRAKEAQENLVQGLIRCNEIGLTIGAYLGLFRNIGSYQSGDFEHDFSVGEMFPQSNDEKALSIKGFVDAGLPLSSALRLSGYSEEEITQILEEKNQESAQNDNLLAQSLINFNRG